jgi:hypothetical protein
MEGMEVKVEGVEVKGVEMGVEGEEVEEGKGVGVEEMVVQVKVKGVKGVKAMEV